MQDNKKLILRFRDLVTENGETISQHKEIINKTEDCVWWAWWKKGHEYLPKNMFAEFSGFAQNGAIEIYLIDSGQYKLYKATCTDIRMDCENPIESPEKEKTPEYYNRNTYFAWFKLTKIEECKPDELSRFSYLDVEGLFEDETADYSLFLNKRVCNIKELT